MKLMPTRLAWAIACAYSLTLPAYAIQTEHQLEAVTVQSEAARPTLPANLPASHAGMSQQQIAESINVINTEDVVKYLPSTQVRKRYIGDRNSIIATRTAGQTSSARSLLYADGLLLSNLLGNSYAYPPRWNLIGPEEVSRVDMIYGPFSAEYPGNAVGSVVLLTTRMPERFEAHVKAQLFNEHYTQYNTNQNSSGGKAETMLGNKHGAWSWMLEAGHLDSHGHPMQFAVNPKSYTGTATGTAVQGAVTDIDPTGQSRLVLGATSIDHTVQDNANFKLAWDISPDLRASYTLGYWSNTSDVSFDSYLHNGQGNAVSSGIINIAGKKYDLANAFQASQRKEEHLMNALSLKQNTGGTWDWETTASWYNIGKDEQRTAAVGDRGAGTITRMDGTGWKTFDVKADWRPDGSRASAHQFRFGYHYDQYELDSRSYATNDWKNGAQGAQTAAFTGKTSTQALFAQDTWRFSPAWRAILGGRYEWWKAFDGRTASTKGSFNHAERNETYFSPKAALQFDATPDWLLRASLGRAYRFPTVAELFQGSPTGSNTIINNNPNLEPEQATTFEFTAERQLDNGRLRITAFQEQLRNALNSQTNTSVTPTVTNIQNIDRVRTNGIELALEMNDVADVRGLDLRGSLTYAKSKILENNNNPSSVGNAYPGIPDWRATLLASYRHNDRLSYSLAARYSGSQAYDVNNSVVKDNIYGTNSSYFIMDARLNYKFDKAVRASIGVDNLTNNKSYAYHPMPQRTIHAELKFDY